MSSESKLKYLVTGAAGFIGMYTAKRLLERWLRSFGQYLLFLKWNLCLVLGCLFDRRQHHGIRFVRGPFL